MPTNSFHADPTTQRPGRITDPADIRPDDIPLCDGYDEERGHHGLAFDKDREVFAYRLPISLRDAIAAARERAGKAVTA